MRSRLRLIVRLATFWLGFMIVTRILFLSYNYDYSSQLTIAEILQSLLHGLKMDLSLAGYFLMLYGLVLSISILTKRTSWVYHFIHPFTIVALFASCVIVVVDLELYRHWGFRMNTTPLLYMGSEAVGSVNPWVLLKLCLILFLLFATGVFLYVKTIVKKCKPLPVAPKASIAAMIAFTGLMFLPIRGSFTVAPMNTGFVYFHKSKVFPNHAAINVVWNFIYSLRKSAHIVYPETLFDKGKTMEYFNDLHPKQDTNTVLVSQTKPNVILIILESFTADVVEPLGGMPGLCPEMNKLCGEGVLFDNFYASGDRTDKGLISILSGYPAQPQTSIIKYPAKTQRLPYLSREFQKLGYHTSFVYGGDVDFANFRSYLTGCGFNNITSLDDFPDELDEGKWGVQDQHVFDRALNELDSARMPFMKVILTQSSHEPFTVPMEPFIKGKDEESLFLNACHYTDKCLGEFIGKARQQPWWQQTLVVITADHGHRHPRNKELKDKERFRIPLLLLGALNVSDSVVHTFANQTDIANTLLGQVGASNPAFTFSKNIFGTPVQSFAAYFFNDGYGFVAPGKYIIYDNPGKQFLRSDGASDKDLDISKAYQQMLFIDYNSK